MLRLPGEAFRHVFQKRFFQRREISRHRIVGITFTSQRDKQRLIQLGSRREKLLSLMKSVPVIPLQRWTRGYVSVEHVRPRNQSVNCQQTSQRVSGENFVRSD